MLLVVIARARLQMRNPEGCEHGIPTRQIVGVVVEGIPVDVAIRRGDVGGFVQGELARIVIDHVGDGAARLAGAARDGSSRCRPC